MDNWLSSGGFPPVDWVASAVLTGITKTED